MTLPVTSLLKVTTVSTASALDEICIYFELHRNRIILFYVRLLFPSIMCVKFIHIDAFDRSFLFIAVYFMAEICHSLPILLLMELGVFPQGYYECWVWEYSDTCPWVDLSVDFCWMHSQGWHDRAQGVRKSRAPIFLFQLYHPVLLKLKTLIPLCD